MTIGGRLKTARKRHGISQAELAKRIDISRGVITNIEYGLVTEPQPIIIDAIARCLNINKDWLLTGEGEMNDTGDAQRSARVLLEIYDRAKALSEDEQLYVLDVIKAMKARLKDKHEATD